MNLPMVIFSNFPSDPAEYQADVKLIMDQTIKSYGPEEWRLVVLTCELHRHLGIYAIIGAKMGLYAREYFEAGLDEIQIISHAGSRPSLSCLNDGLQVSTGATIGHGLLSMATEVSLSPSADFIYHNKKVTIQLKDEYRDRVEADVENAFFKKNGLTEDYWLEIRLLALKYWKDYDRKQVFQVFKPNPDQEQYIQIHS